jgi:Ca2+-binding RTX toxin-like protein
MSMTLTPAQIAELQTKRDANDYAGAYDLMESWTAGSVDPDVELVHTWLLGAGDINRGEGPFAALVQAYNQRQGLLRGRPVSEADNQEASDYIARLVIDHALANSAIPDFEQITRFDAEGGRYLYRDPAYNGDTTQSQAANWTGTFLISPFGKDETGRLLSTGTPNAMDTLDDLKNVLFAHGAFKKGILANFPLPPDSPKGWGSAKDAIIELDEKERLFPAEYVGTRFSPLDNLIADMMEGRAAESGFDLVRTLDKNDTLDQLMSAWRGRVVSGTTDDSFATTAATFFAGIASDTQRNTRLERLDGKSAEELVALANSDAKYRNALLSLSAFALELDASDYASRNLDLYDPATGAGSLTRRYLEDRADMLVFKQQFDRHDLAYDETLGVDDYPATTGFVGNWHYTDYAWTDRFGDPVRLGIDGNGLAVPYNQIKFGSEAGETLEGLDPDPLVSGGGQDRLYGGAGDDVLDGKGGTDHLEGGTGVDTYHLATDGSVDTILDVDGQGAIEIDGESIAGTYSVAGWDDNSYRDAADQVKLTVDGNDLRLYRRDGETWQAVGRVQDWESGELGLTLDDTPFEPGEGLGGEARQTIEATDATRFTKIWGNAAPLDVFINNGRKSWSSGSSGDDRFYLGTDYDTALGNGGHDLLVGGPGRDYLVGGPGWGDADVAANDHDAVIGGSGIDILDGGVGDDTLIAMDNPDQRLSGGSGEQGEWLMGNDGDDRLYGSSDADVLTGGAGNDEIRGGEGQDILLGDADLMPVRRYMGVTEGGITREWTWDDASSSYQSALIDAFTLIPSDSFEWTADFDETDYTLDPTYGFMTNQRVVDGGGNDILHGEGGDDFIAGQTGDDMLYGGDGDDILYGDDSQPLPDGSATGNDILHAGAGADRLYGGQGDDVLNADEDDGDRDELYGGEDMDVLYGGTGGDRLDGGAGGDILEAGPDGSELFGGEGNDYLQGGAGDDTLDGGIDDDSYRLSGGADRIDDAAGSDAYLISADSLTDAASVTEIADSDGLGRLVFDGERIEADTLEAVDDSHWEAKNGRYRLHLTGGTLVITAEPAADHPGQVRVLGFSDGDFGLTLPEPVDDSNHPPETGATLADQSIDEASAFELVLPADAFSDPDGDSLSLAARQSNGDPLPGWLAFDASTATFTGTPGDADVGDLSIQVTATDPDGETASQTFALTVNDINQAPQADTALTAQTVDEDTAFAYTLPADAFSDPDGDALTLDARQSSGDPLPDWLAFDASTATFTGTPANGDVGDLSIQVTATDPDGEAASQAFDLTVNNVNDAPEVGTALSDATVETGDAWTYALPDDAFTDVDAGDSLSLAAQQSNGDPLPDWLAFDPGDATFSGTPGEGDIADLSLEVTATDQAGASVSQTFGLNVQAGMETVTGDDGDNWLFGGGGDERVRGGAGDDTLYAGGGNDHIHGGTGDDRLIGGFGDDTYHVERGDGADRITETGWIGGEDTLAFGADIAPDQLWFSRDGRDLSIDIIGTEDRVTVTDWFGWLGRESVERIEVSSGESLAAAEVNNLVQAMASFDPPGADETSIPSDYRDQLEPVIAAGWQ